MVAGPVSGIAAKPNFTVLPALGVAFSIGLQIVAVYVACRFVLISFAPSLSFGDQQAISLMASIVFGVAAVIAYPRAQARAGVTYEVPSEQIHFTVGQRVRAVRKLGHVANGSVGTVTGKDLRKRHSRNGDHYLVDWDDGVALAVNTGEIEKLN